MDLAQHRARPRRRRRTAAVVATALVFSVVVVVASPRPAAAHLDIGTIVGCNPPSEYAYDTESCATKTGVNDQSGSLVVEPEGSDVSVTMTGLAPEGEYSITFLVPGSGADCHSYNPDAGVYSLLGTNVDGRPNTVPGPYFVVGTGTGTYPTVSTPSRLSMGIGKICVQDEPQHVEGNKLSVTVAGSGGPGWSCYPARPGEVRAEHAGPATSVSWLPPASSCGLSITGYLVRAVSAPGAPAGEVTVCATCLAASFGELTRGGVYYFEVQATYSAAVPGPPGRSNQILHGGLDGGPVAGAEVRGGAGGRSFRHGACTQGQATDHPVSTSSGNFWHTFEDLAIPGRGLPLALSRTYNAHPGEAVPDGPLGFGWSFSYGMRLEGMGSGTITLTEEGGSQVAFTGPGPSYTPAAPRVAASLARNPADGSYTLTRRRQEIVEFDAGGRLRALQDLNGYRTELAYRPDGTLETVRDPGGRTLAFAWTATVPPRIKSVTDANEPSEDPRTVRFSYGAGDTGPDLTKVEDVTGGFTEFAYDANHRMTRMRLPEQHSASVPIAADPRVVENVYDASGRVERQTDQLGRPTSFDYSEAGSTVVTEPASTQPGGATVHHLRKDTYLEGVLVSRTVGYGTPAPATWFYEYDPATLGCTRATDPNLGTWLATYDPATGERSSSTDPHDHTTRWTYNDVGQVRTMTDPMGIVTTSTYDGSWGADAGNLVAVSAPLNDGAGAVVATRTTTYNYHEDGNPHRGEVTSVVDPVQHAANPTQPKKWRYTYDAHGMPDSVTDPLGHRSSADFDAVGRMTSRTSPRGHAPGADPADFTTRLDYESDNLIKKVTDPHGKFSERRYDANRNLEWSKDADGRVTTHDYDHADQLIATTRGAGTPEAVTTRTDYWGNGRVKAQHDAADRATTYTYDAQERLSTTTDPLGRVTTFGYDRAGHRTTTKDHGGTCVSPKRGCTTYGYDEAGQLVSVDYSDSAIDVTAIAYDDNGRRTAMTDDTGTSAWTWDSLGRMTSSTTGAGVAGGGQTVSYGWDLAGNLRCITYPNGAGHACGTGNFNNPSSVQRHFDDAGRLDWVEDWLGNRTTFGHDPDGNWTTKALPPASGVSETRTYDRAGRLETMAADKGPASLASFDYGRTDAGLVASVDSAGVPDDDRAYAYDAAGRLCWSAPVAGQCPSPPGGALRYGFDAADNLNRVGLTTQMFNQAHELCWTAPAATVPADPTCASTPPQHTRYTYDDRGNRTQSIPPAGPASTHAYDQANRLASATVPPTAAGQFTPLAPARILDTRAGIHTGTCVPSPCSLLGANSPLEVQVTGQGGVPAAGVAAVVLNVTVTEPTTGPSGSYLTVYPSDAALPNASNLNYVTGQTVPNLVTVKVGPDGKVKINNANGTAHVIADVAGWFSTTAPLTGARFHPLAPARILDTRPEAGPTGTCPPSTCTAVSSSAALRVKATGQGGVPASGVSAVVMNVAVVSPTQASFLKVYPSNEPEPNASNLNFGAGQVVANLVTVKLGPDGAFLLDNDAGSVHVIADVAGWYTEAGASTGALFTPLAPTRVLDTRSGIHTGTCTPSPCARLGANGYPKTVEVQMAGQGGVPATGATAVAVNVSVVQPSEASFLKVYPADLAEAPNASNLNFGAGQVAVPNLVVVKLGANGRLKVDLHDGAADLVMDVAGWYDDSGTVSPLPQSYSYRYDGDGLRMATTTPAATTAFTWDVSGGLPLLLSEGPVNASTRYVYGPGGLPLARITSNDQVTYYHQDQLGSTRLLTKGSDGSVSATYSYDPYGQLTGITGGSAAAQPFRFAGEYTDAETGFVYLRARYYDPATGQFLTRDPIEAETREAYGYVGGNPLNGTDPSGLMGPAACTTESNTPTCNAARGGPPEKHGFINGPTLKQTLGAVGAVSGAVAATAIIVTTLPVSMPVAATAGSVAAIAGTVNTLSTIGHASIECTDGGGRGECVSDILNIGVSGASFGMGRLASVLSRSDELAALAAPARIYESTFAFLDASWTFSSGIARRLSRGANC